VTLDAFLTLAVLAVTLVLLARNRIAPALAVFGADVALLVTGVLEPADAFLGFSNPAPFTVAGLYIVARAVEKTGGLRPLVKAVLDHPRQGSGRSPARGWPSRPVRRGLLRLLPGVAVSSAFLNNTPIVAMLTPEVSSWAESRGRPPSR
jgi:Na+/H+ antiporter NhaD/arsenite permease-like protein